MTDVEDFNVRRKRYDVFMATELGQLHRAHEQALINYWRVDADDRVESQTLMELDRISKETTHAYVTKLMELAGV
jgi:hypothetical protein